MSRRPACPTAAGATSDNIVARINLPTMRHPQHERGDVAAAAIQGLIALEQDPENRLE